MDKYPYRHRLKRMSGWRIPPPKEPTKSREEFAEERQEKVRWLISKGYLKSKRITDALLKVRREEFIPFVYKDYAYLEVPLPIPGEQATISCPHSYPLFYEALGLGEGDRFLEIGLGSGYGTALAREIVGSDGLVVSLEIDPVTFEFARSNLEEAGYRDLVLIIGDGGYGYPELATYDKICITAACHQVPPPLVEQLGMGGRLIGPVKRAGIQELVLLEKSRKGVKTRTVCEVLYISLRGRYGGM